MLIRRIITSRSSHLFAIFGAECRKLMTKNVLFPMLSDLSIKYNIKIQVFNSLLIAGWEHLYFSAIHAIMAFENDYNISKKPEMELLLYSIGKRQIKEAVSIMGVSNDTSNLVYVLLASNDFTITRLANAKNEILSKLHCTENDALFSVTEEKIPVIKKMFEISDIELDLVQTTLKNPQVSITHCVLERLSLLPLSV